MKAEALKGHLDGLILAVLEGGELHGYAVKEAFARPPTAASTFRPERCIRRCTGWSRPG